MTRYCQVFGTDAKGAEVCFYKSQGEDLNFLNLDSAIANAKKISYLSDGAATAKAIDDMASFTGIQTGELYCFVRRGMHACYTGRSSSYGQIVICKQKDLLNEDAFLRHILGFRLLTEAQIIGGNLSKEDVERWEDVSPADLQRLSQVRRDSLCLAAGLLMKGKKVMLRLPEGHGFMELCRQVMLELFTLLPEAVRPQISFSTCRTEGDFPKLAGVQLLLVDKTVTRSGAYILVDLDAPTDKVSESIRKWSQESQERRRDIDEILVAESGAPGWCYQFLEAYYDSKAWWWKQENPEKRLTSYDKIISAMKHEAFGVHPVFSVQQNWEDFCKRIPQLVQYEEGLPELLLDEYFRVKKNGDKMLEFVGRVQHKKGLFRAGLSEEEYKEVQEASMITKETLKQVKEQKEEFDQSVKTMQEKYDQSVKTLQEEHDRDVKKQKDEFDAALQKERQYLAEQYKEQRETIERYNSAQQEAIDTYHTSQMEALRKHREELNRQRQEDNATRQRESENLSNQLHSINDQIAKSNRQTKELIQGLNASIDGKVDTLNQNLQETDQRHQASSGLMKQELTNLINDSSVKQEKVQNEMKARLNTLENTVNTNASQQKNETDALNKRVNSIKRSERGSGNKAALILAISGCGLAVAVIVLLIVGMVKYLPAAQYAKREAEATPTLVPVTPAPTDTPAPTAEPTLTPAPTVVPYELGKYIAVCNNYALTLTETGEGRWVYANDLVQVVIRTRTEGEIVEKEEIPSQDGKFILTVHVLSESQDTDKNSETNKLQQELQNTLSQVAGYAPTPEPEEGSTVWLRQLLKLEDTVTVNRLEEVPETLEALLGETFTDESIYLYEVEYEAETVYLLLSETEDLYEVKATEATAMACRRVIEKVADTEYVLYVFAADEATVNALFLAEAASTSEPTTILEPTATPAATVPSTNAPSTSAPEPLEE